MRPRGVTAKEMPGTMAWGHSGKCKSCVQPNGPGDRPKTRTKTVVVKATLKDETETAADPATQAMKEIHLSNTVSGLNSFMDRRNARLRAQKMRFILENAARSRAA